MRWHRSFRADPRAIRLYDRHYSRRTVGAQNVAPPGRPLVLLTADDLALWVSMLQDPTMQKHAWPGAWGCSVFRNEGAGLSSELITEACAATRAEWGEPPRQGLITFVDQRKVKPKRDPGYCFLMAGFEYVGVTPGGHGRNPLHVLQLAPPPVA